MTLSVKKALLTNITPRKWGQTESLKSVFHRWLKYSRVGAYCSILGTLVYSQPVTSKAVYKAAEWAGLTPSPVVSPNIDEVRLEQSPYDRFISGYKGFDAISSSVDKENIEREDLDLNKNNIIGDTPEEIIKLIDELRVRDEIKYKKEIALLEEILKVSQMIWGPKGPNPYDVNQGDQNLCHGIADIQWGFLTKEHIQKTKERIKVTGFASKNDYKKPNTTVEIGGRIIDVPYKNLEKWIASLTGMPTYSNDDSLAVPILMYALTEGMKPYGGMPNNFSAASSTLTTGKEYCSINTSLLSDDDLIKIFSQAPHTLTKVSTSQIRPQDLTFETVENYWSGIFFPSPKNQTYSDTQVQNFRTATDFAAQRIISPNTTGNSISQNTPNIPKQSNNLKPKGTVEELVLNHMYLVKECKKVNGEYIITIMDAYDSEIDLTLEDVRKHISEVISDSKNFPNLTNQFAVLGVMGLSERLEGLNLSFFRKQKNPGSQIVNSSPSPLPPRTLPVLSQVQSAVRSFE